MKLKPQIIGRRVVVDFPDDDILGVPAKVDTGADSSAVWASDINVEDGRLSFTLFDKTSAYYTGNRIVTKDFQVISVKNSFGAVEYRYRVRLTIILEGRKIKSRFTLADRSRNTYPILIGRKTLHGKFLVDVAHSPNIDEKKSVLIVSARKTKSVKVFIEDINRLMHQADVYHASYDDFVFTIKDQLNSVSVTPLGKDLADFDIVHFKTSVQRDITAALARYAQVKGVKVLDNIVKYFPTTSKLYQYSILDAAGIAVPDSVFMMPSRLTKSYDHYVESLGSPFVLKGIHASKGELNELIHTAADFQRVAEEAEEKQLYLIGQRFVPNKGDYRILVLGGRITLAIYRTRQDDTTHLNNTSTGSSAQLIEITNLPTQVQIDAIRATDLLERDVAGVDMVQNEGTGEWLCFEVNDGPQLATGAFPQEKRQVFADYLQRELEK